MIRNDPSFLIIMQRYTSTASAAVFDKNHLGLVTSSEHQFFGIVAVQYGSLAPLLTLEGTVIAIFVRACVRERPRRESVFVCLLNSLPHSEEQVFYFVGACDWKGRGTE